MSRKRNTRKVEVPTDNIYPDLKELSEDKSFVESDDYSESEGNSSLNVLSSSRSSNFSSDNKSFTDNKHQTPKGSPQVQNNSKISGRKSIHSKKPIDNVEKEQSSGIFWVLCCILFVLCVMFGFFVMNMYSEKGGNLQNQPPAKSVMELYLEEVNNLKKQFPAQSTDTWATINAAVKRVIMEEKPKRPSAVLILYDDVQESTAKCLMEKTAHIITKAYSSISPQMVGSYLTNFSGKEEFDDSIKSHFLSGGKVVCLHELHTLSAEWAKLLHGYCDNDNAPFRSVHYFFTFKASLDGQGKPTKIAEKELTDLWDKEFGSDNLVALLSRIANSVIIPTEESSNPC